MQVIQGQPLQQQFGELFEVDLKDNTGALLEIPAELHAGFEPAARELEELIAYNGVEDVLRWAKAGKEQENG